MEWRLHIYLLLSSFLVLLLTPSAAEQSGSPFFIFGDSLLDAGNNNYINTSAFQANFWPYGITYFHYPTGRFSDGRLICDFIAEYAHLPLIPPFLQPGKPQLDYGVNFASGGAGALVESNKGQVIDLHMQLGNYKKVGKWFMDKFGDAKAKMRFAKAVYLFSIGSNDYITLVTNSSNHMNFHSKPEFVDMVISNIISVITEIYKIGGRKFAFLNLPPLGCVPFLRILNEEGNYNCLKEVSSYAILHNQALNKLTKELPGFKYSLYDLYISGQLLIDQPSIYGFKEGKTACCGTGKFRGIYSCGGNGVVKEFELCKDIDKHVFWDAAHLTEEAYELIADEMWSNTNNKFYLGSYTIKDLFYHA